MVKGPYEWMAMKADGRIYLIEVDYGVPLVVPLQVEVAHTDLSEVTGMVFIDVDAVVVLHRQRGQSYGQPAN